MTRIPVRFGAAALGLATLFATSTAGAATAVPGVGTSQTTTNVVSVQVGKDGSLVGLRLLSDEGRSTIDKTINANPQAYSRLTPLAVSSSAVPALTTLGQTVGSTATLESKQPDGSPQVSAQSVDLAHPSPSLTVPAELVTGTLTAANLTSGVDASGARSAMNVSLADVSLAAGLVGVHSVSSTLGTDAAGAATNGTRSVHVDAVSVLNLGNLLRGLGIDPTKLSIPTVSALLDQLHATVSAIPAGSTLSDYVTSVNAAIDQVQTVIANANTVTSGAVTAVTGILGSNPLGAAGTVDPVATLNSVIDQLQVKLADALNTSLTTLLNTALLEVDGVQVGVTTKSVSDLSGSSAGITAAVGSVKIGGITIPGLDLTSAAAQINGLVTTVNNDIHNVLGTVSPDLANVVSVSLLDQAQSVTASGGYNRARAGVTAATATVTPPATLATIVSTLGAAANQIGSTIASLSGGAVTVVDPTVAMSTLAGTVNLAQAVGALSQGVTLKVGEVLSASDFAPGAVPAATNTLPRTGAESGLFAGLAVLFGVLGWGIRRMIRRPALD